ncbi:MAG TPA: cytochrome c biogenesis protein CcsA [Elusimicrobiota bacterium]|jgi:cytochrome c-type biogenesis protein CcsB|nr:cytochrome c biogenesis protein CcsA [Elusimicrobiota bacterium]
MELGLFRAAFALYAVAASLAFAYLTSREESLTLWMWRLLGVALAAHALSFSARFDAFWSFPENRFFLPANTFFGVLSWLALANALVFWIVEGLARLHLLGAFVLPWTVLAMGAALLWADPSVGALTPELRSHWLNVHPLLLMACYAGFANAFGVGLAYLVQERQIKSRKPSQLCYRLPALEELDRIHFRIIAACLPVLTVGIAMGGVWAHRVWGRYWSWDAKEVWTAVTWLCYAAFLALRRSGGLRGRKAVFVAMTGFATVLFAVFAVNRLSLRHGYLSRYR